MKKTGLVMMLTMLVLFAAACGTNKATNQPEAPAASQVVTTEAPAQTTESTTIDDINKRGKLIIGTSGTFRPMTFMDESGKLAGVDIEIGEKIAEKLGVELEWVAGNVSGLIPAVTANKTDLVMSSLTMNPERMEVIDFSVPYTSLGAVAVVKGSDTTVKDVTELDGLIVGVIGGSGNQAITESIGGYKELKEYPGHGEAILDLKAGRIDVYVAGSIAAYDYITNDKDGEPLKVVGELYDEMHIGVGIRKDEAELKALVDSVIEEMKQDGSLHVLLDKWI